MGNEWGNYNRPKSYLPSLNGYLPTLQNSSVSHVINDVRNITQAPEPLIMMTVLSTISVALQGLIDIELPIGKISPVSIMGLTIADSGERKSTVEKLCMEAVRDHQRKQENLHREKLIRYRIDKEIFDTKKNKIKSLIASNLDNTEKCEEYTELLIKLETSKPLLPKTTKLIYEDCTPEALILGLHINSPFGYLGSSEGAVLLNNQAMAAAPKMNAIWSGDEVTIDRKSSESFTLYFSRLTIHIMTQPSALSGFIKKDKYDLRGMGLWARFLVCAPYTTCGTRLIGNSKNSRKYLDIFNKRVLELLNSVTELDSIEEKITVAFTPEAKAVWIDIADHIEFEMRPEGKYSTAKDHASKLAENIARVAALLHYIDHPFDENITTETLWNAINLCSFFSDEFLRVFNTPPQQMQDAESLFHWFETHKQNGIRYIKKNIILQFGPRSIRKKNALDLAIDILSQENYLAPIAVNKTTVVDIHPGIPYSQEQLDYDLSVN
jgi:hypothetical protein